MAQGAQVCDCKRDWLSVRFPLEENIYLNLYLHSFFLMFRQRAALSSTAEHALLPEFIRKFRTECLNTAMCGI